MMAEQLLFLLVGQMFFTNTAAFYQPNFPPNVPTYTPNNIDELKKHLCNQRNHKGHCTDDSPAKIIINKKFDFTRSEGINHETGCFHPTGSGKCTSKGQLKLNVVNQCAGLTPTPVTYSKAGRMGLKVGSNKIIIGQNGGAIKGKGLRLENSRNVEIRNLKITEINPQLIWGGDAIDLIGVDNVLIDGNYIKNIGRQMIVSHSGSNKRVMISNNVFDGKTPYAAYCDGHHYWLWAFLGEQDQITLQNNVIKNTSGRGPRLVAAKNSKTILHLIQNIFYDISITGLIDLDDTKSSILLEGNVFVNVKEIVHQNKGNLYMPHNQRQQKRCKGPLGRPCLLNTVENSGGTNFHNADQVMKDFETVKKLVAKPISMLNSITKWIKLPNHVKKHIH